MTEKEIRLCVKPRAFAEAWFRLLPTNKSYESAYEELEGYYEAYFGHRKYSCYDSFRVVKNRIYNSK